MSRASLDRLLGGPQFTLDVWRFSFVAIYWNKHGRGVVAESRAGTEDFKAFVAARATNPRGESKTGEHEQSE